AMTIPPLCFTDELVFSVVTLICPVISADQTQYNHYTIYGVQCTHSCAKQGETYYWCKNPVSLMGWDYCSPTKNTDYYGNPCQQDCGKYGEDYYWCNNKHGSWSWEKCGPVEPKKKTKWVDRGNIRVITFSATPDNRSIAEVTNRNRITRSNLTESTNYRFHLQGIEIIDNQRYFNVQIQENIHRNNRESTTVSQILVPQQSILQGLIPERYIRRLYESGMYHQPPTKCLETAV
uniref:Uncharacterized protein n=1 Tax=Astyanax mexicanus TaxID=7994 RepID=A0A3B1KKP8_ASTMX